ncbi:MAG TPA: MmgE/PrpD family protein [Bryobacteraceae bacterium]|nr:MmgE/PrpD family protein [Bryobacteraceae bacterium]
MTTPYTRQLLEFLHPLQARDLPEEVLDRARYFLLDYLACTIRGSREPSSAAIQRMIERVSAAGCSTVIGTRIRTIPTLAAMANGAASHAIEMDDTHSGGSIHLGTTMYSAALALAENLPDTSSETFFAAVVAGFEAAARIAMAAQPREHYALGFHMTGTCGVFGAAITSAKVLGLNFDQTLAAVGIAGSMASGSMEFLADGSWTKRIHPGLAAQNGIQAALLAAEGYTGPLAILEGRDGFLHGHSRHPIAELLTENLGHSFEILRTAVKPHACCRYMQGPIDAILGLMRENNIASSDIQRIEVAVLEAGWGIVAEPRDKKYRPATVVDTQFSMPFGAAVAALEGVAGLDQFTADKAREPKIRELMHKVALVKDPTIEETFPREWPARVTIELSQGPSYEKFVRYPKGDPENSLSWDELAAKFRALTGREPVDLSNPAAIPALCS